MPIENKDLTKIVNKSQHNRVEFLGSETVLISIIC